jgi:hypothetical protein
MLLFATGNVLSRTESSSELDMSNAFASALESSAQIVRNNDAITACRLITARIRSAEGAGDPDGRKNGYVLNMREGLQGSACGFILCDCAAERKTTSASRRAARRRR